MPMDLAAVSSVGVQQEGVALAAWPQRTSDG
jgi:hypothetical protein